jgi:hypothetical protein
MAFTAKVGLMDLAAFLAPGDYPVFRVGNSPDDKPWGHVRCRPSGRLSWVSCDPAPAGDRLFLTLKLPGYHLDDDGSLLEAIASDPELEAWVIISGEVKDCRLVQDQYYLLRLTDLVRVLD